MANPAHRVVLELTSADPQVWDGVLGNVENLRAALGQEATEVAVVAHGKGLGALLATAPTAARIAALGGAVRFRACSNTMRKQGIAREALAPAVEPVDSGVAEVVRLQEAGFAYVKGG